MCSRDEKWHDMCSKCQIKPQHVVHSWTRVLHFQQQFKAPHQATIEEVIRLAQMFPCFVEEEGNRALMREVTEEELKKVMGNFQKDKSPGPDGWTIDFFLDLFDILGKDLL